MLGIELISATYGKVYNGTTDDQTHDKRSPCVVSTSQHKHEEIFENICEYCGIVGNMFLNSDFLRLVGNFL